MHVNVVNAVGDGKKLKERKSSVASRIHGEKSVRAKMAVRGGGLFTNLFLDQMRRI